MKLIIGGLAQGKLDYVLEKYQLKKEQVWDGVFPEEERETNVVIYNLQHWVRERVQKEESLDAIWTFVEEHPDVILICNEVGNGVVPMDPMERAYREQTGRLLIKLASQAESVERVVCGIGQKLK